MDLNNLKIALNKIKAGTFVKLSTVTEVPIKASFAKNGYKIYKNTTIITRFGITYSNIKAVKEMLSNKDSAPKKERVSNNYWEDKKMRILCNPNKNAYYLYHFPINSKKLSKSVYHIFKDGEEISFDKDLLKELVINSYWNKNTTYTRMVNINNIISIG